MLEGSPRSIQPIVSSLIRPGNQIPLVLSDSKRELRTAMKVYSDPVTLEHANVFVLNMPEYLFKGTLDLPQLF